jgi:glyoxylase-like metal-dependent hydrolase (beta-lactamase superfamily II)
LLADPQISGFETGAMRIWRIAERCGPAAPADILLPGIEPDLVTRNEGWLAPDHLDPASRLLVISIHSWLMEIDGRVILVDACVGNDKDRQRPETSEFHRWQTDYVDQLARAGFTPDDVDAVMCTHLHVDHCGWNTRLDNGRWVPTFRNADYFFARRELDFWEEMANAGTDHPNQEVFSDSVLPILEAGLARPFEGQFDIARGLVAEPAPGHTPGHAILRARGGTECVFSGDVMHHVLQVHDPDLNSCFCEEPERARRTRRELLEDMADRDALLLPAHFGAPHMGRVISSGDGFAFDFGAP